MSNQPVRVSHEIDDFAAPGIYPGGTNTILDASYVLWDYNGRQPPNSNCAVKLVCQPTDGSNEGKPHDVYWNVGSAADFIPEPPLGAFMLSDKPDKKPSQQCNWFFALKHFQDNCGLEKGRLSTDKGLKVLIGSEVTFIRVPPPKRDFKEEAGLDPTTGQMTAPHQRTANQVLVPSKARFSWEVMGKARPKAQAAPAATAPATTAAPVNGAPPVAVSGDDPVVIAIGQILTENDGAIETANLAKLVTEKLSVVQGMTAGRRIKLIKVVNDAEQLAALATSQGWALDTADGILSVA
jgi:hypothetical protein